MRRFITLLLGFTAISATKAQQGAHLSFLPYQITAQQYQPAHLYMNRAANFAIAGDYGLNLQTNGVPLQQFLQFQGKKEIHLTESVIGSLVSSMNPQGNSLQQSSQIGILTNMRIKKQPFSVGISRRQWLNGALDNPQTVGLALRGNAAYAGQEVADKGISATSVSGLEVALGYAFVVKKYYVGLRLKGFRGDQLLDVEKLSYSLYTAPLGESLTLAADYALYRNTQQSYGAALDFGIVRYVSSRLTSVQFSATDLGVINWTTDKVAGTLPKTTFSGIDFSRFVGNNITNSDSVLRNVTDSLRTIFLPDTTKNVKRTTYMPATFRLGATIRLNDKSRLHTLASYAPFAVVATPCVSVAYHYDALKRGRGTVGVNIFGGGIERYGAGICLNSDLALTERLRLRMTAAADSFGLFAPKEMRGFCARLSASLLLVTRNYGVTIFPD